MFAGVGSNLRTAKWLPKQSPYTVWQVNFGWAALMCSTRDQLEYFSTDVDHKPFSSWRSAEQPTAAMAVVRHKEAIHSGHFMVSEFEAEAQVTKLYEH